jgi:hypothetical protein
VKLPVFIQTEDASKNEKIKKNLCGLKNERIPLSEVPSKAFIKANASEAYYEGTSM